jgi:DNA repair photolyase
MKPLYEPKGRAKEYGDYAINIDATCPHKCFYCYCPTFLHKTKEEFFNYKGHRAGIVEAVKAQIEKENVTGKLIHLTFVGDPYPKGYDSSTTREIIKLLKERGNHVQLLTKNGVDAERDFDLLDGNDWFGVTYAGYPNLADGISEHEPGAGAPYLRLRALMYAKSKHIGTWVSCEPVLGDNDVLYLIEKADYIDHFKIGKLNYRPSDINWAEFGKEAERLCKLYGRDYYIKDDLRKEMERL